MGLSANQLNLDVLVDRDSDILIPAKAKKPIGIRNPIFSSFLMLSLILYIFRWALNSFTPIYNILIAGVVIWCFIQKERVGKTYILDDDGLIVPYTWLTRKLIPYNNIVQVDEEHIIDGDKKQAAIRIFIDTPLIKYNITGQSESNILLSTLEYHSFDLNSFADELSAKIRSNSGSVNTLAQRLTDQVTRSWSNRWINIGNNMLDALSEAIFYLFVLEMFFVGSLNYSLWVNPNGLPLGVAILLIYGAIVLLIQVSNKPQAIIGMRPHELGPVLYDEEEFITNIRIISICQPFTVEFLDCEVLYKEGETKGVGSLKQIQPMTAPPGELTYVVAQIHGNHSRAIGAKIQFRYQEREKSDIIYETTLDWS